MIELDWTLPASALVFLLTLAAFNRLLLRPLLQVLDERKARTTDVFESASADGDRYHSLVSEYEERVKQERQAGYRRAEAVRSEALKARQDMVAEARRNGQEMVSEAKHRLQKEKESAKRQLEGEARHIAELISGRVLSGS